MKLKTLILSLLSAPLLFGAAVDPAPFGTLVDISGDDPSRVYSPQSKWADSNSQGVANFCDGLHNRASRYSVPYDVIYTLEEAKVVNAYSIRIYNSPDRAPREWTFYGSNDFSKDNYAAATWVSLDTQEEAIGWSNDERRLYVFANADAYKSYRLEVKKNVDGTNAQVSELDFHYLVSTIEVTGTPSKVGDVDYSTRTAQIGSEVTLSSFDGEWQDDGETARATCTGYRLYKSPNGTDWDLWQSGEGTSVTFIAPAGKVKLEWQYDASFKIEVTSDPNGTFSGTGWYKGGETCTLTPVPAEGYQFIGWAGEHGSIDAGQTVFAVTEALSLVPMFALVDNSTVYVSTTGSDENSGLSPVLPFATLSHALETLGADGGKIYLLDGTYQEPEMAAGEYVIDAPVTIEGLSGDAAKVTVIANKDRRTFTLANQNACLRYLTVKGCGSTNADTAKLGAAVNLSAGEVLDCIVTGTFCRHWEANGSVLMTGGRIARCVFKDCFMRAGAVCVSATGGLIEDCLMYDNNYDANNAGTFMVNLSGSAVMVNCTITDNHMKGDCGVKVDSADCRVVNCIISGNTSADSKTAHVYGGNAKYYKNFIGCVTEIEIPGATDCTAGGVVFKDAVGKDFHLMPSSAGFDAGVDASAYAVSTTDLDGLPRIVGDKVDVGCFEHQQNEFTCAFVCSIDRKTTPVTASFDASVLKAPAGDIEYVWDFGDGKGTTVVNDKTASHVYEIGGTYDVTLTVRSGGASVSKVEEKLVKISAPVTYVSTGNPNEAAPYATEETAAATLATAVAFAEDGGEVVILPGLYKQGAVVLIDKPIVLRGETGDPEDVVISNTVFNSSLRVLELHNAGALVTGVTLSNGKTNGNNLHGGTLFINNGGGTVSNCVIRSGAVCGWSSWAGGVAMNNGLLTHCVVTGDFTTDPDVKASNADPCGLVVYLNGANARMENCLIHDVVAKPITGNESKAASCIGPLVSVVYGTMANCTVAVDYTHRGDWPATIGSFDGGSAIYCANNASAQVINCVAAGFKRNDGTVVPFGGQASRFFACAGDAAVEGFEVAVDTREKMFADPANGDYQPLRGGVLCNAGVAVELSSTTDLAGNPRVHKVIDIGCYELPPAKGLSIIVR